ncbi:MAG TPA: CopG family transcriptional regulator [Actinomycetota bacterium]|nr:CopG family transcriptional regulator [Actinomycetota bacterium]
MARRKKTELGPIGPDIDLDTEEVYLADGTRLTEDVAAELAEEVFGRRPGRPSITGEPAKTPNLTVRVPPEVRNSLEEIAARQGRRVADVTRDAVTEYIERHAS